jgi:hypothetical protein
VAEKIKTWGKRVKGERAKREKTMKEPDFFNLLAFSPFRHFPPNLFQPDGG